MEVALKMFRRGERGGYDARQRGRLPVVDHAEVWRRLAALLGVSPHRARQLLPTDTVEALTSAARQSPEQLLMALDGGRGSTYAFSGLAEDAAPFTYLGPEDTRSDVEGGRTSFRLSEFDEESDDFDPRPVDPSVSRLQAHAKRVGYAFSSALLPGLPPELASVGDFFARAEVGETVRALTALDQEAVDAAGERALPLVPFGMSPLTFAIGGRAIARALRRHWRRWRFGENDEVLLDEAGEGGPHHLRWSSLTTNVVLSTELGPGLGFALLAWLLQVARLRPLLFDGFVTESGPQTSALRLKQASFEPNIQMQWGTKGDR